jgi:hypothetical protein
MKEHWIKYKKGEAQPPEYGKYLVYIEELNIWTLEIWNGCGWSHNNNLITHYLKVITP